MFATTRVAVDVPPMQGSLLSMGERTLPSHVGRLDRTELAGGAWIDHAAGWLGGADAWFDTMARELSWRRARRTMYDKIVDVPRLIWTRPDPGDTPTPAEDDIVRAWTRLGDVFAEHYRRPMPRLGANFYRDGRDSVAWHRDNVVDPDDSLVAIVSLGAGRTFTMRPVGGGPVHRFELGWGDLLVMGGATQRHFEHAVPKVRSASPRISVMIRG